MEVKTIEDGEHFRYFFVGIPSTLNMKFSTISLPTNNNNHINPPSAGGFWTKYTYVQLES